MVCKTFQHCWTLLYIFWQFEETIHILLKATTALIIYDHAVNSFGKDWVTCVVFVGYHSQARDSKISFPVTLPCWPILLAACVSHQKHWAQDFKSLPILYNCVNLLCFRYLKSEIIYQCSAELLESVCIILQNVADDQKNYYSTKHSFQITIENYATN